MLAAEMRDVKLKIALEEHSQLVQFGEGRIELRLLAGAPKNLAQDLSRKLQQWTGSRWIVSISDAAGEKTLAEQRRAEEEEALREIRRHPAVQSVFHYFPDAEIKQVRPLDEAKGQDQRRRKGRE
jgi:DNA polymerase-3 subunit gamma/tau